MAEQRKESKRKIAEKKLEIRLAVTFFSCFCFLEKILHATKMRIQLSIMHEEIHVLKKQEVLNGCLKFLNYQRLQSAAAASANS